MALVMPEPLCPSDIDCLTHRVSDDTTVFRTTGKVPTRFESHHPRLITRGFLSLKAG